MEPIEYLRALRRRWAIVAAAVLVGAFLGLATAPQNPASSARASSSFKATSTLALDPDLAKAASTSATTSGGLSVNAMAFYTTTGEVPVRVAKKLVFRGDPALLATQVAATADDKLDTVQITSTLPDGARAALLANTFANELIGFLDGRAEANQQRTLSTVGGRVDALEKQISDLSAQLANPAAPRADVLKAQRDALVHQYSLAYERYQQLTQLGVPTAGLSLLQAATPVPTAEKGAFTAPRARAPRALLGAAIGLLVGFGIVLLLERVDTSLRNRDEVEDAFERPVLAEVPLARDGGRRELVVLSAPASSAAEAYRTLRTALIIGAGGKGPSTNGESQAGAATTRVILVSSAQKGEGKSTVAANLAASFAERGRSVLVLSADMRRPEVHRYLGGAVGPGFSDVLARRGRALRDVVQDTDVPGVGLIASGTPVDAPGRLLQGAGHVLASCRILADVVVVDAPPILEAHDASELAQFVDAVVLVCRARRTTDEVARRTGEVLDRIGAPFEGVVLTVPSHWEGPRAGIRRGTPAHRARQFADAQEGTVGASEIGATAPEHHQRRLRSFGSRQARSPGREP